MNDLAILKQTAQTMSSREISELTGKEHHHVLRDIRAYVGAVVQMERGIDVRSMDWSGKEGVELFGYTPIGGVTMAFETNPQNGQSYPIYHLDKNATLTIISGYNILLRKRIIDRWQELETQLPRELSRLEILQIALQAEQEKIALECKVNELQPKADALDRISHAIGNQNVRDTAKTLDKNQNQFVDWCLKNDWLYRDDASRLKAYQHRINQGFMAQKSVIYKGQDGAERVTMQPMFTPKGITHLANKFKKAVA